MIHKSARAITKYRKTSRPTHQRPRIPSCHTQTQTPLHHTSPPAHHQHHTNTPNTPNTPAHLHITHNISTQTHHHTNTPSHHTQTPPHHHTPHTPPHKHATHQHTSHHHSTTQHHQAWSCYPQRPAIQRGRRPQASAPISQPDRNQPQAPNAYSSVQPSHLTSTTPMDQSYSQGGYQHSFSHWTPATREPSPPRIPNYTDSEMR
jgi:hypothetical protein